jgi:hypothetical protein
VSGFADTVMLLDNSGMNANTGLLTFT